jgi:hypothetical protein
VVNREPTPLGDALAALTRDLGGPPLDVLTALSDNWAQIVGPQLAAVTEAGAFADGVLTIVAFEPSAATALRHGARQLGERLSSVCGQGVVRRLDVRVRRRRRTRDVTSE